MEKLTEKFTYDEIDFSSPLVMGNLVRATEHVKDGGKIIFRGRTIVCHCVPENQVRCHDCCFDFLSEYCDFVSCMPEERLDNTFAYFTIEPAKKGESHE